MSIPAKTTMTEHDNERAIANQAAKALNDKSLEAARNGRVFYVKNDMLMTRSPDSEPVVIKYLSGRNPEIAKKFDRNKTYKIKKRASLMNKMSNKA